MRAKDAWLQGRLSEVLDVPYVHLVFTLPHCLNALYGAHPRWVIDTLFTCTAHTLTEFAANPKWMGVAGGKPAFSLVLHTWTQDLLVHLHVHAVMACGVLEQDGQGARWVTPARQPNYLFPGEALSSVFRGKFMAALGQARRTGQIEHDPQATQALWNERQRQLYKHAWVVYAKAPLGGPAQVLEYLSRYTHRTAISNERIRAITPEEVAFNVRANDKGGKRLERLAGEEFVRRFLLHILPTGLKRIRHYGSVGLKLQGGPTHSGPPVFANATVQCAGQGVCPRLFGPGGQNRCEFVPMLQGGANARDAGAAGGLALARVTKQRVTPTPGATMRQGLANLRAIEAAPRRCWARLWASDGRTLPTGHRTCSLEALGGAIGGTLTLHRSQNAPAAGP
jgi:hypothetical protein